MTSLELAAITAAGCASSAATCSARLSGERRSSPQTNLMNSPVARSVTAFQFAGAPPPEANRLRRTRGSAANCCSASQVPSVEP